MSKLSDLIELLKNTSSTKAKQEILEQNKDNISLRMLFYATLDPMINYYIRGTGIDADPMFTVENLRELTDADISTVITVLDGRAKTGHAARDWIQSLMCELVPEDRQLLRLMLNRDLDCKVAGGLVNRVWKNLIFEYPCLLAKELDEKRAEELVKENHEEYIVQLKADGGRCNGINRVGSVSFFSRNGNALTTHGVFDEIMKHFEGYMIDGELLVIKDGDTKNRQTGNGIFNKAVRGTISAEEAATFHFVVWDMVPLDCFDKCFDDTPYSVRLNNLSEKIRNIGHNIQISLIDTKFVKTLDEVTDYYKQAVSEGHEGAILKLPSLKWEDSRSKDMLKLKEIKECDLLCVGTIPHKKNPELVGSLILSSFEGTMVTQCGSGLTDEDRAKDPSEFLGKIFSVEYNAIIKARDSEIYSLFLPRVKMLRLDKTEADPFSKL